MMDLRRMGRLFRWPRDKLSVQFYCATYIIAKRCKRGKWCPADCRRLTVQAERCRLAVGLLARPAYGTTLSESV
jgi:hypothetical protein